MPEEMPAELYPLGSKAWPSRDSDPYGLFCGGECMASNPCGECSRELDEWLSNEDNGRHVAKVLEWFRALNDVCLDRFRDGVFMTSLIGPRTERWFEAVSYELTIMVDKVLELGIEQPQDFKPRGMPIQHRAEEFEQAGRVEHYAVDPESGVITRQAGELDGTEKPSDGF